MKFINAREFDRKSGCSPHGQPGQVRRTWGTRPGARAWLIIFQRSQVTQTNRLYSTVDNIVRGSIEVGNGRASKCHGDEPA
jgi:hypothetical protein